MDETSGATHTARAKDEFFSAGMHMFHITGFPQQSGVLTRKVGAPQGARLEVWRIDSAESVIFPAQVPKASRSAPEFLVGQSGNRTLHAPKRSWKITLDHQALFTSLDDVRQSQVDVQRSFPDARGAGLAPVP